MIISSRPDKFPAGSIAMDPTALHLVESSIATLLQEFESIGALALPNFNSPVRHMSQSKHDAIMELLTTVEDLLREGQL